MWKFAGLIAFVPHLLATIEAGARRPGFDHRARFLSELGERGSPTAFTMNYLGIIPTGILFIIFGGSLWLRHRAERALAVAGALIALHGSCRVLVAIFPCDAGCRPVAPSMSQLVHNTAAAAALVSLTAALFTAGAWFITRRRGPVPIAATAILGGIALVAQATLLTHPLDDHVGLYQRLALGALQLWVAALALHLMSGSPTSLDSTES